MVGLGTMLCAAATTLLFLAETRAFAVEPICEILGPTIGFTAVAKEQLLAKASTPRRYYQPSPLFIEPVCAPTISAGRAGRWFGDAAAMVATQGTGTAIDFKILTRAPRCHDSYGTFQYCSNPLCFYYYPCNAHRLQGDVVTGGGKVALPQNLPPYTFDQPFVVDTSGTHPELSPCTQAIDHIDDMSAALAEGRKPGEPPSAARPIIDLGDLRVDRQDTYVLESTPGQDVTFYRVRNLALEAGKLYGYGGYSYQTEGAFLEFAAGPHQSIVLNVTGNLKIGAGSKVLDFGGDSIINVVGVGPAIALRRQVEVQANLIAADRVLLVLARGGGYEFPYGSLSKAIARKLKIYGSGFFGYYMLTADGCGSPSGAFLDPLG